MPCTTDSHQDQPAAPNRLTQRAASDGPNQIWLQDITYVPTNRGWLCLELVMDMWSRKIVDWAMADHLRSELAVSALQMAQSQRRHGKDLQMHPDRGGQYASRETCAFLEHLGWIASMSRAGNPYENAWTESAIRIIKNEVLGHNLPANYATARQQLFVGIQCCITNAAVTVPWQRIACSV